MTSALLAVALVVLIGLPLAALFEPSLGHRARLGVAFLLSAGAVTLVMLFASFARVSWSLPVVLVPLFAVSIGAIPFVRRRTTRSVAVGALHPVAIAVDLVTLLSVAGYAFFAVVAKPWEWDFWAIWGLKAKEFFLAHGVNFVYLGRPDNYYSHPDYPPLLPLQFDFVALLEGSWNDRWMGTISVAFAIAMLLVLREELERSTGSPLVAALGTLALSGAACSPWVGLADGPLVAFVTAGLVILSRGLRDDVPDAIVTGSVLVGLAALTKNEGVSFVIAMSAASLLLTKRRALHTVLPATLVMAPWLFARAAAATTTDVFEGRFLARMLERLSDPVGFLSTFAGGHFERLEHWTILALLVVLTPAIAKRERFLLATAGLQILAYVVVYAGTLNDLASHVQSSAGRISSHLAPIAGIVCVAGIAEMLKRREEQQSEREDEDEPAV